MKRRRKESGFALLMVFLMAACVAIMLYMEMPRVAFDAERQKELLLIDRGNQFKRAIQLFVRDRKNNPTGAYPASIDQLENFNNHRYLRHKYVDPMTGKDEWRLIHYGGVPGVFTDSVTLSQNQTKKDSGSTGSDYIKTLQSFDAPSSQQQQGGGLSAAMRRRPSDTAGAPGSADGGASGAGGSQGNNGDAGGGSGSPGITGSSLGLPGGAPGGLPGANGLPGQAGRGGGPGATAAQTPCTAYIGTCAPTTTNTNQQAGAGGQGGVQGQIGLPGQVGQQGQMPGGMVGAGGMPGGTPGLPGGQNPAAQTAAQSMIANLLTSPRPGGMPATSPGTVMSGGIAGVASKYEADGIMVIADRTAINEWEFIYDQTKDLPTANPLGGGPGRPVNGNQNGTNPAGGPGGMPGGMGPGGPGRGPGGGGQQ